MGSRKQEILTQNCVNLQGWERAICEAQNQIISAKEKIGRLELSIETFEEMRAKGEPFPGEPIASRQDTAA
jgi:hypothetical protein